MCDAQASFQLFGHRFNQAFEGLLIPGDKALGGLAFFDFTNLFRIARRFGKQFCVLDFMFGRQSDNHALGIEARTPGASHNLMELART